MAKFIVIQQMKILADWAMGAVGEVKQGFSKFMLLGSYLLCWCKVSII
jgi:hypothetical protein